MRTTFNPKRRLCSEAQLGERVRDLRGRESELRYNGNPQHKKNPGDFGLDPPSAPRLGKTLCDSTGIHTRDEARQLLLDGCLRGLFSAQEREGWPQNIWAVKDDQALEAQAEGNGIYHGYPMPQNDPLREEVLRRWGQS